MPGLFAAVSDETFDQMCHVPMVLGGCESDDFFDSKVDAQFECCMFYVGLLVALLWGDGSCNR